MFDYEKFENDVIQQMKSILQQWKKENDDLYIFALDCASGFNSIGVMANTNHYLAEQDEPDSEDYWCYKYCEEEWELFYTFEALSAEMRLYISGQGDEFIHPQTFRCTKKFMEHQSNLINACKKALLSLKKHIDESHIDIILTFCIREYLDKKEKVGIFQQLNTVQAAKEYSKHINDFV